MSFRKDLGAVSSYALAVEAGYEGTEEEFAAEQAEFAKNAKLVAEAKNAAESAKKGAEDAKTDAETAANIAATAAIRQPVIRSGTWWLWDFEKGEYVDSGVSVRPEDAVLFVPQDKSEDEKTQARANIGALAESEVKDSELIESAENATVLVLEGESIKRVAGDKLGGVSSWNDLTDKPFGDTRKTEALIPLNTVEGNVVTWRLFKVADSIDFDINDVTHITRSSNYDDWVFENVPVVIDREFAAADIAAVIGDGRVLVGVYIATQEEADAYWDDDPATNPFTTGLYMYVNGAEDGQLVDVTFSFIGNTGELTPIEGKYLPKGTPWIEEGATLLAETDATGITHPTFGQMWAVYGGVPNLKAGETYTITYNGTEYKCVCQAAPSGLISDPNAVAMGNFSPVGGENTGEPFAMLVSYEYQEVDIIDLAGSAAVKVGIKGIVAHKIDPRCLPDGAPTVFWVDVEIGEDAITLKNTTFAAIVNAAKNGRHVVCRLIHVLAGRFYCDFFNVSRVDEQSGVYFKDWEYTANNSKSVMVITISPDNSVKAEGSTFQ